jgi:tetratricopeptide (TPR) repeat protein
MSFTGKWYGFGQDPVFDEALRAYEACEFQAAADGFREVLKKPVGEDLKSQARSFLVTSLGSIGRAMLADNQPMDARESFLEAIELEPRYPDLWLGLAVAAGKLTDEATEKVAASKARELNPKYSRAILYEALIALKEGEGGRASEILKELPADSIPYGPDDLLIDALQATFANEGEEANAIAAQAEDAAKEHEFDIAVSLYRQAAQLRPTYADIRCKLAQALLELDHLEEAETHLRAALDINPNYAEAWAQLGIALKRQSRRAEAKQAFVKAYEIDKHHPIAKLEIKRIF